MKSRQLLKALLLCTPLLWLSCSSWEDIASPDEFRPLKVISVSPMSVHAGDNIIITGENFIDNKEYNQVWFGGNIRGNVDSATSTKLFLKVPKGARTGALSVSNGMYTDTLKSAFTVVKESPFKTASISFGGLKFIRTKINYSYSPPNSNFTETVVDTLLDSSAITLKRCISPIQKSYISNTLGPCVYDSNIPYADSIFQCFEYSSNSTGSNAKYQVMEMEVDSIQMVIKNLKVLQYQNSNSDNGSDWNYAFCIKYIIGITNAPYTVVNSKIYIHLNSDQIKKYFTLYDSFYENTVRQKGKSSFSKLTQTRNGIYQILPDAYFELTLE
ncbi:MAG: IPT/TIG domain-containing protein [Bacteroidota bacterium]